MTQDNKSKRLSKVARELNVGISTIVEFLNKKNIDVKENPNSKINLDTYGILVEEFNKDGQMKKESEKLNLGVHRSKREIISINKDEEQALTDNHDKVSKVTTTKDVSSSTEKSGKTEDSNDNLTQSSPINKKVKKTEPLESGGSNPVKVVGKIDLDNLNLKTRPAKKSRKEREKERLERQKKSQPVKKEIANKKEGSESNTSKSRPENRRKPPIKNKVVENKRNKVPEKVEPKVVEKTSVVEKNDSVKKKTEDNFIESKIEKLTGPVVVGKIDLPVDKKSKPAVASNADKKKKRRKRIKKDKVNVNQPQGQNKRATPRKPGAVAPERRRNINAKNNSVRSNYHKHEVNEVDVQKQIKETLSRLTSKGKGKGAKHRRDKRDAVYQKSQKEIAKNEENKNIIKVTEFVSVNELANMMDVQVNQVIATCMNLGLFVSINQRLDAETMALVADEFSYKVEFVSAEVLDAIVDDSQDDEESLIARPPIVTVMGHVDHGKTSLLDYIRKSNIIDGEAGGITQHIGAYSVKRDDGKIITFLDTPGHEAFTAMRARGAQITDVAIIIISADDNIMPQTKEAINHAQAAGVPIVFAINKIDKDGANPDKIKEELAQMNLMVEEWGGKYQSQDISAKQGLNVEKLLEKVLLESEMLDLKANPDKNAIGVVIESSLDKGRGYIATVLVQSGTLKIGDVILAGAFNGHVKAMYNERGLRIETAGPSTPVQILGLNGAPQAGDKFNVMNSDQEAKDIANKREQLQREQGLRAQKYITLDEIGRRIAVGNFHELNIIVKGDVDGSIEALSDSIIKLSTGEIQVNVIHKAVGQISESDILLAAASDAIIIGFQVRPSLAARKLAEKETIDIRLYSIIYDAINEMRDAMEGMLSPEIKEEVTGTTEVMEVFKITKVGTIAGCMVREGKINRNNKVRLIRDGIVVFAGLLGSLKRFKDDVKEVNNGYECGLNIDKFNDIKVGDIIEAYHEVEVRKKL